MRCGRFTARDGRPNGGEFYRLLSFLLKPTIDRKISLAADINLSVYQMPWNRDLFGEKRDLTREIAENSAVGRSDGAFRDWYGRKRTLCRFQTGFSRVRRKTARWTTRSAHAIKVCAGVALERLF